MTTYTAITAKRFRQEAGSPAEKLAAEFKAIQDNCNHQGPTFIIAASDSLHPGRADYVCDGTDDQVEFNAAVANGGHIVAVKGSYVFSSEVLLPDDTTLEFLAGSSIFVPSAHFMTVYTKYTDPFSAIITNTDHVGGNENIQIIGADIDFNGDNGKSLTQGWAGIWLDNCTKCLIEDCVGYDVVYNVNWANGRSYGILLSDCTKSLINRCEGSHCGYEGIGLRGDNSYIIVQNSCGYDNRQHLLQATSWAPHVQGSFSNIVFDKCFGDGRIIFHGPNGKGSNNSKITNCIVPKIDVYGELVNIKVAGNIISDKIYIYNELGNFLNNIVIDGNIIYRDVDSPATGILVQSDESGMDISGINLVNNQLNNTQIELRTTSGSNTDISDVFIVNNLFTGSGNIYGVYIYGLGAGDFNNISIESNLFNRSSRYFINAVTQGGGDINDICINHNTVECQRFLNVSRWGGSGEINGITITDNHIKDGTTTLVRTDSTVPFSLLHIYNNKIGSIGQILVGIIDDIKISENILYSGITIFGTGTFTNKIVRNNHKYVTENSGTDTIASASTSKAVTHGLSVTPVAGDIMVTPMESLGNASFFWVDTYTSTQFTIHTNAAPGADTDFAWRAIVL